MTCIFKKKAQSPAKVNLFLEVGERDESGYHRITTLMDPINLTDEITLEISTACGETVETRFSHNQSHSNSISISISHHATHGTIIKKDNPVLTIPMGEDSVTKISQLFLKTTQVKNVLISWSIDKKIPSPAGLGGGSSNAATALTLLQECYPKQLTKQQCIALLAESGCDMPFFYYNQRAIFHNHGEKLFHLFRDTTPFFYLLFFPAEKKKSTWEAYQKIKPAQNLTPPAEILNRYQINEHIRSPHLFFQNSFSSLYDQNPLTQIKERLHPFKPLTTMLSGSGPAFFSLFSNRDSRDEAFELFSYNEEIIPVKGDSLCRI